MALPLRRNTAALNIPLGPMLSAADGNTELTTLTIPASAIHILKASASSFTSPASGATHIGAGVYTFPLSASDTDTLGPLTVYCHPSGALAVRTECTVIAEDSYDTLFASTGAMRANLTKIGGDDCTVAASGSPTAQLHLKHLWVNAGSGGAAVRISSEVQALHVYSTYKSAVSIWGGYSQPPEPAVGIYGSSVAAVYIDSSGSEGVEIVTPTGVEPIVVNYTALRDWVWQAATRALTEGGVNGIAQAVWNYATRIITGLSLDAKNDVLNAVTDDGIKLDGSEINDVWNELVNADYGLAQLVRSATPANRLVVTASGAASAVAAQPGDAMTLTSDYDAAKTPDGVQKGVALAGFTFLMEDEGGQPATGRTVTGSVSLDGAAPVPLTNSVSEVGAGLYAVNLTAAELAGDVVVLIFTATGAKATCFTIRTVS